MTYPDALRFLYELRVFGQKLGLETMRLLLDRLGRPQESLRFIHLAGTNGKGSVAAMCQAVLTAAGYRSGLYTSPHLVSFRERIQVGDQLIAPDAVVELVDQLQPILADVADVQHGRHPTFFEAVTALALCHFRQQDVECVVWETGLGGRLDATNIVTPAVAVITSIGIDHAEHLGPGLAQIAAEKCGIIKPGFPVVTCLQEPSAQEVLVSTCRERGCALTTVGTNLRAEPVTVADDNQAVRVSGSDRSDGLYQIPLTGGEQVTNCGLAVAALEQCGLPVTTEALARGLARTRWPGRFQLVPGDPPVIVDAAHNPAAIECLVQTLSRRYRGRSIGILLGVLADKSAAEMCRLLAPVAAGVCCVPVRGERATTAPELLAGHLRMAREELLVTTAPATTSGLAVLRSGGYDLVVVTGSLFLAGEVLAEIAPPYGIAPDPITVSD